MADKLSWRDESPWLLLLLCLAVAARCYVAWTRMDQLTIDRDAYLGIAENVSQGKGFSTPGTAAPTAFRPPLYPLLLATNLTIPDRQWSVAVWNILAGMWTIWFVDRLGVALGLGSRRHIATLFVAVDPLLLNATAQPMTEVVFTLLVAAWLWAVTCPSGPDYTLRRALWIGVLFGLAVLCRPTVWPLAGLMAMVWIAGHLFTAIGRQNFRRDFLHLIPVTIGLLVVISPWVIRNQRVFGVPILTTTHGGYTILLANNPVYFRDVVQQPWGTTWSGESLSRWQVDVDQKMKAELGPNVNEVQSDAWLNAEAKHYIREHPQEFVQSMWYRIRALWSVFPRGDNRQLSAAIQYGVALFYVVQFLLAAIGLLSILRHREWPAWLPGLLLIVTVQGVHLVYWTDARMRTPLEPVLALLAARALMRHRLLP